MKKLSLRSGLLATTTICGAALSTMAGGTLVATVATLLPTAVQAQDYTSGALVGTVTDSAGKPVSGATVTLTSVAQGQVRTITSNTNGQFSESGLQPGDYSVDVTAAGYTDFHGTAQIVISQETRFTYSLTAVGAEPQTVVVKGKRVRQDFTKTTTGLTVDLDTLVAQNPIARNLTAVTMLAPTVTQGNPGFGNVASFGGGSVAENAYYIDGLNVTNPDSYVGGAAVPFDFYKTIEVKTGGYQAEFGRATGGVVNATTKSGTNNFMFAVHGNYQPMDLRSDQLDTYSSRGEYSSVKNNQLSVEMSGPIWKDHLYAYGLYQATDYESTAAGYRTGTYSVLKNKDPFIGVKLDGYITPTQHFSFTYFDTTSEDRTTSYGFSDTLAEDTTINGVTRLAGANVVGFAGVAGANFALHPTNHVMAVGDEVSQSVNEIGGENWVLNYNGKVTDWLTVSAAYGEAGDRNNVLPANTADYYVTSTYNDDFTENLGASSVISTTQPDLSIETTEWKRKFYRADADLRFDLVGRHHVRFGFDHEENTLLKPTTLVGGAAPVTYDYVADPDYVVPDTGPCSDESAPCAPVVLKATYEVLGVGEVSSENVAYYIQDSWDVTPNLNLQIGVRNDNFKQSNLAGLTYLDLKNNISPRLGFSWDPTGEGDWKFYGTLTANFIPPAMGLGARGRDLYFSEYFDAPAGGFQVDPVTGLPTSVGAAHPSPDNGYASPCPEGMSSAPGLSSAVAGVAACSVNGNGLTAPTNAQTSTDLKATQEDEIILGTTYRANDEWTFGLSYIQRNLKRVSEDSDFLDAVTKYLDENGLDSSQYSGPDAIFGDYYYVWNVGDHDVKINLRAPLPGETEVRQITLTADQLGHYHNPKRSYQALVFDFKRAFDGKWGIQGSYTYGRSYGNYEGTVKSDVGNGVQDNPPGATIAFDSPAFEDYGTGLLSNDRTHTFKIWGSYAITPELLVGANAILQSPNKFSCLGAHPAVPGSPSYPGDVYANGYGPYSHYCDGAPSPLGKGNKADMVKNIDLSLRYTVPSDYSLGGKLVLRADIFNLLDQHSVVTRRVTYQSTFNGPVNTAYGQPTAYNTPRYMRVGFDLNY